MPLDLIVTGGVALVAADVATWCFKSAAKSAKSAAQNQRQLRFDVTKRERQRRNEIERDTRRALAQEAYEQRGAWLDMLSECMDTVWEMRHEMRGLKRKFNDLIRTNRNMLKESALTYEQQRAIRDGNFNLERGVARLDAYAGPYLQDFIHQIIQAKRDARNNNFVEPPMPESTLPDDFPVVGDHLRLSEAETKVLCQSNRLSLGCEQVGRFYPMAKWEAQPKTMDVFVSEFDRNDGEWVLSPAKGAISTSTRAFEPTPITATIYSHKRGGCEAIWHSPFAESVSMFLPYALAADSTKSAPWGTKAQLYVQNVDYHCRSIIVGQHSRLASDDVGQCLSITVESTSAIASFQNAFRTSTDTFWVRGEASQQIRLRLVTGEEFVVSKSTDGKLVVGEYVGMRLGSAEGDIVKCSIGLAVNESMEIAGATDATEFLDRIRVKLDEQAELRSIFQEEALETRKYQLLLEAELEASSRKSRTTIRANSYAVANDSKPRIEVVFKSRDSLGKVDVRMAIEVKSRSKSIQGFILSVDPSESQIRCSFGRESLDDFRNNRVLTSEPLKCCEVDADVRRQVQALAQFRNVSFLEGRGDDERLAFRLLRRTMLGLPNDFAAKTVESDPETEGFKQLNPDQQAAVRMINSRQPLSLILGPPGTGKTDTIAVALEAYIRRNPNARIAVVSQANVAVCEALHKLKSRYPECDILRHASAHALESLSETSKALSQERLRTDFLSDLNDGAERPEWAASIRDAFVRECQDEHFLSHRVLRALSQSASVYGCTLSVLGRLASGAALFDLVVIDEAAKASLPECMVAAISAKRLALVGDHKQLLPFLDEKILDRAGDHRDDRKEIEDLWNRSLFMRMWQNSCSDSSVQLSTQYRSRSAIREAISHLFYDGRLLAGRSDESKIVPFQESLVWVDTLRLRGHKQVNRSLVNEDEAKCVMETIKMLSLLTPNPSKVTVAVICFYGAQRNLLDRLIKESPDAANFESCEARTVDASQGGQWDIVVLAITRTSGSPIFVGNPNRLNVSLSRAKDLAVVVGNLQYCLREERQGSRLADFARYVQSNVNNGVRICAPTPEGTIAKRFGIRSSPRKVDRKRNRRHGR